MASVLRCGIIGYPQYLQFNTSAQVKHVLHEGGVQCLKVEGGAQLSKAVSKLPEVSLIYSVSLFITHKK